MYFKLHNFDNKYKLYEGENLEVLNSLCDKYQNKIDAIYIDPLYNSNNKQFKCYNDNIKNWQNFIQERLMVSRELLKEDGLIFISIGEEVCRLKLLLDDIYGRENEIAMIAVKTPNQTEGTEVIKNTDYLLIYKKTSISHLFLPTKPQEARCTTSKPSQTIHTISFPKGIRVVNIPDGIYEQPRQVGGNEDLTLVSDEPIIIKNGVTQNKIKLRGRWSCPNDLKAYFAKIEGKTDEPVFNKYGKELVDFYFYDTKFQPRLVKRGFAKPTTWWDNFLSRGRDELKLLIGNNNFSYPKHSSLIKYIISIATNNPNAIILDFFGGSGTTLQSVFELNEEYNTNMECILITQNENNIVNNITLPRINKILKTPA